MQQNQQFIDSLIGLKKHYELVCSSYSGLITDSKERLTNHVNMLLFDSTVSDQTLTETIVSMRHQWQNSIRDNEHKIYHAKEQIDHVNALLVDLIEMPHGQPEVDIQTSTLEKEEVTSLSEAVEIISDDSHTQIKGDLLQEMPLSDSVPARGNSNELPDEVLSFAPVLLPQYQSLTQIEAVESLLKTYAGAVLHIDYIMRTLYGNRSPTIEVMFEILNLGVTEGLWHQIPDEPDCYTWDLKLVEPDESKGRENEQILEQEHPIEQILEQEHPIEQILEQEHSTEFMLPDYQHLSLTQAIKLVLSESYPNSLNIDEVTHSLFGSIVPSSRSRVKNCLKNGVELEYWERVAGKKGIYISKRQPTVVKSTSVVSTEKSQSEILPEYQQNSFYNSILMVFEESYPRPLNAKDVTQKLFGYVEMSNQARVSRALVTGISNERWSKISGQKGIYILSKNANVVDSLPSVEIEHSKSELLPQYQNISFVEAVEKVLKESYPRPLNIADVTQKMFGSVEIKSRKKVTGWLVGAANSNRIRRVAGQTGVYIYRDSSKSKK